MRLFDVLCFLQCLEVPSQRKKSPELAFLKIPTEAEPIVPDRHVQFVTDNVQRTMETLISSFKHAAVFYSLRAESDIRVSDFNNSQNFDKSKPLPVHEWMGVHVDGHSAQITRLYWQSKKFGGTFVFRYLPQSLETLFIDDNKFHGTFVTKDIPPKIGYMSLEGNYFTGTVTWPKLPASLTFLDIRNNALSGLMDLRTVPRTLETIYIRGNNIRVVKTMPQEKQNAESWGGDSNYLLDQSFIEVEQVGETEECDDEESAERNLPLVSSDDELEAFQHPDADIKGVPKESSQEQELSPWTLSTIQCLLYFFVWVVLVFIGNLFVF